MKILVLAPQPFYQDRGTPIAVRMLAQSLAQMGHTVHLLVFAEGEEIAMPGVIVHRHAKLPWIRGIKPGFSLKKLLCDVFLFIKCMQLIRGGRFDLVHAVEESVFMACIVKLIWKVPYVYDMDSCMSAQLVDKIPCLRVLRFPFEGLEKMAMRGSLGVLPVCESLENIVRRHAPTCHVVRLEDVSLVREDDGASDEDLRKELQIDGLIVMYVGNLEKYQGIDLLLRGFQLARDGRKDLHLIFIGGSEDDILFYKNRSLELNIDDHVTFCGSRPVHRLGYYLRQADILVSPRIQGENTPMKLYSYLDSGVPVLATNLATHTQVLDMGIACLVGCTPEEMSRGLLSLANDEILRQKLAMRAKQRVQERHSLQAFQNNLTLFYEQLMPAGNVQQSTLPADAAEGN